MIQVLLCCCQCFIFDQLIHCVVVESTHLFIEYFEDAVARYEVLLGHLRWNVDVGVKDVDLEVFEQVLANSLSGVSIEVIGKFL